MSDTDSSEVMKELMYVLEVDYPEVGRSAHCVSESPVILKSYAQKICDEMLTDCELPTVDLIWTETWDNCFVALGQADGTDYIISPITVLT